MKKVRSNEKLNNTYTFRGIRALQKKKKIAFAFVVVPRAELRASGLTIEYLSAKVGRIRVVTFG